MRTRIDDFNPPSPPLDLEPTEERLRTLAVFDHYKYLPTRHLRVAARVGWKPPRDLNRGHYIGVPWAKEARQDGCRNAERTWEIRERGETMRGKPAFHPNDPSYPHRLLCDLTQFSFDRAEFEIPGLRKITLAEILADERCPQETRNEEHPNIIPISGYKVVPDADLFGYEYTREDGKQSYIFIHGFEADRGTETGEPHKDETKRSKAKKKTIKDMVGHYATYIRDGIYFYRYGLKNVLIPFVFDNAPALKRAMDIVQKDVEPDLWENFAFRLVSTDPKDFAPPTAWAVTEDWLQVGGRTFNIMELLNGSTRASEQSGQDIGGHKAA